MSRFIEERRWLNLFLLGILTAIICVFPAKFAAAQSSTTMSETVAKRNTIGVVTVTPTSGLVDGSTAAFSYVLHTAGAPAPTSETVQFLDGATAVGSAQTIGTVSGSNLLPYSQVDPSHGWGTNGTAPTPTINNVTGPDGSATSATRIVYPITSGSSSGMTYAVPGTSYASLPMTLSVWAQSTSATTLTLTIADSPSVAASQSSTCAVTSTWQRCSLTYTFPSGAGTGFSATVASANQAAQTINVWGVQVTQATSAGPYVSTIGTARPTGGAGGTVSFPYSMLEPGSHSITVSYAGDSNFVASTSNALTVVVGSATPALTLTAAPASTSAYGTSLSFTAVLPAPSGNTGDIPTGTVQFFDGATSLSTITIASGSAALTLSGTGSLTAGSHSITAVYSGDSRFNAVTSSVLTYVVTKASGAVTIAATSSGNPSIYGDSVTFSTVLTSSSGVTPTGTLTVQDSGSTIGTITLSGGTGTLVIPLFTAGTHSLTFTYSGDLNYQ